MKMVMKENQVLVIKASQQIVNYIHCHPCDRNLTKPECEKQKWKIWLHVVLLEVNAIKSYF